MPEPENETTATGSATATETTPRLANMRAWFTALVESSNDAIIGVTLDGRIVSWNSGAERMYGWKASEVIGHHVLETLVPPERAHETNAFMLHVAEGTRLDSFETERRRRDGVRVPVAITASPVRDPHGRVVGASTIARDISKRRQAEQAMRENQQWAHDLIASAPDAVIVIDESGLVTDWNPVATEVFGWTPEEAMGEPLHELIIPEADRDAHRNGLAMYLLRDDGPMVGGRICTNGLHKNGTPVPIELTVLAHAVGGGRRFTAFVRDQSYAYEIATRLRDRPEDSGLGSHHATPR